MNDYLTAQVADQIAYLRYERARASGAKARKPQGIELPKAPDPKRGPEVPEDRVLELLFAPRA